MEIKINDTKDKITCRICGKQYRRIFGKHLKFNHPEIDTDEYRRMFPNAPIQSEEDYKNTIKNSGKHMKDPKYKKMFSEMIRGEKNPNHKSNTTESERKSRSPYSKEFIGWENEDQRKEFISNVNKNKPNQTQLDYWIDKGYTEEEAISKRRARQTTFTLEKCIAKYGEEDGRKIFTERQIKWQDSLLKNGNLKQGYSKSSQELFNELKNYLSTEIKYATNGGEFKLPKKNGGVWIYDFTDIDNKKIIEYHGDHYHANPIMFNENDLPHPFRKTKTAQEIWTKDNEKIETAKEFGFDTFIIWDSEFRKNRKNTIEKCLNFLKNQ